MISISCLNCAEDTRYNPEDYKNIDKPSIKCGKCGETNPLTDPLKEDDLQTPDDLE
ncbi:MAG: hypothetical protein WB053_08140 [Nitrososphaeraceae archaeon]